LKGEKTMAGKNGNGEGTIIERNDGRWCAAVTVGRNSKGKTKRKWIYGKSRKEVAKKMNTLLYKVNSDEYLDPSKLTFKEYSQKWINLYKKQALKPKSYDRLLNTYMMVAKSMIGSLQLCNIETDLIQVYISSLTAKYSYSTIKKAYEFINACYKHSILKKDISSNPCIGVVLPREPDDVKEVSAFTKEQQSLIIKEITRTYSTGRDVYRYGYGYIFILNTGLRLGEALALTWNDIDFDKKRVSVTKNLSRVKDYSDKTARKYKFLVQTPKSRAARRTIPLNDKAISALNHIKSIAKQNDCGIVFCTANGKYVDPGNYSELFSSVCNKMGFYGYSVHSLRHTFATNLFRKNVDIKYISELLGHADIKTTYNTYIHLLDDVSDYAISAINSL
jgi:integrase